MVSARARTLALTRMRPRCGPADILAEGREARWGWAVFLEIVDEVLRFLSEMKHFFFN